jgi:hypothetical protein
MPSPRRWGLEARGRERPAAAGDLRICGSRGRGREQFWRDRPGRDRDGCPRAGYAGCETEQHEGDPHGHPRCPAWTDPAVVAPDRRSLHGSGLAARASLFPGHPPPASSFTPARGSVCCSPRSRHWLPPSRTVTESVDGDGVARGVHLGRRANRL